LRESHGYELTDKVEEADLLLVNTCSIREKAQEKVFSELGRWRPLKEARPGVMIGVGGCVASQEGEGITRRAPFVDVVFGPQTLHRLPELIENARSRKGPVVDISFPEIEKFDCLPEPRAEGPTAFVSIMEGCSKYCSFCVVPYTRGEEVSRPFDGIIAECVSLAGQDVREINLLGQNVNAYRGPMHDGQIADLATLIYYVAIIDGIERIRFTTSHPVEFTDSLIQAYAEVPKLANYLHLPVQHGSDRILARMKRGHTILEYKQKIRKLRKARPDISLSSDFIVGFPGESEAEFECTMSLVREVKYAQAYSFKYSGRPGTPAAALEDQVPEEVKSARLQELQTLLRTQQSAFNQSCVGREFDVLFERAGRRPGQLVGRSPYLQAVHANGPESLIGAMIKVEILSAGPNSLEADIMYTADSAIIAAE